MKKDFPVIPLFDLNYGSEEEEAILNVLHSKWLTMGPETELLEQEFAAFCGVKHAIAVSSCTTALHLASLTIGVQKDCEVICPALTFVATANSVLYAGGKVVFADITSPDNWTISPADIEKKITSQTQAIIVMHYGGFACQMDEIKTIAQKNNIPIIEDAAHAPGSAYKGQKLGALGAISCFSFFSNKNISTGEGGIICTNDDEYARQIRAMRSHGMTSATIDRHRGLAFSYDVTALGYNYRLDEIHSALARVQLKKLHTGNAQRQKAADRYKNRLKEIDKIKIPFTNGTFDANYHIFPILLDERIDRRSLMVFLREQGIQTSIHYPPVHQFSYYRNLMGKQNLPLTEYIAGHELTLPVFAGITDAQVDYVVDRLIDFLN
jgi:dTDP-4-amino-4,6-dideoxygalactose transaminase